MGNLLWFEKPPAPEEGGIRLVPLNDLRRLHQLLILMIGLQVLVLLALGLR